MRIAVGSDERNYLTDAVVKQLVERGYDVDLYGPLAEQEAYWPRVVRDVAEAVAGGEAQEGVLFCWTGTGVSIAANKVPGVRAALFVRTPKPHAGLVSGTTPTSCVFHCVGFQKRSLKKFSRLGSVRLISPTPKMMPA